MATDARPKGGEEWELVRKGEFAMVLSPWVRVRGHWERLRLDRSFVHDDAAHVAKSLNATRPEAKEPDAMTRIAVALECCEASLENIANRMPS